MSTNLINEAYFNSKNVKVFPCSYRGNYLIEEGTYLGKSFAFDPESRLNTEFNFTTISGLSGGHDSYIISYNQTSSEENAPYLLKCVIGGYYFEINNFDLNSLKIVDEDAQIIGVKNLYIKTKKVVLKEHDDSLYGEVATDSNRYTYVLDSWTSSEALDSRATTQETEYYFTGIKCASEGSTEVSGYTGCLKVAVLTETGIVLNEEQKLAPLHHGSNTAAIRTNYYTADDENKLEKFNIASGLNSFAMGEQTTASGESSHSEGYGTVAAGKRSHAEGSAVSIDPSADNPEELGAYGVASHTEGYNTYVATDSTAGHAEGSRTSVKSKYGHAEGYATKVETPNGASVNDVSTWGGHAEGYKTKTKAAYAHAEGSNTEASGNYAHSEGRSTIAMGLGSHAEGNTTTASGQYSHTEGEGTNASGDYSHAEGYHSMAQGKYSFVVGKNTKTKEDYEGQTVVGHFNNITDGQFIVGTGLNEQARKNSLVVKDNEVTIKDTLKINSASDNNIISSNEVATTIKSRSISLNNKDIDGRAEDVKVEALTKTFTVDSTTTATVTSPSINIQNKTTNNKLTIASTGTDLGNDSQINLKIGTTSKTSITNNSTTQANKELKNNFLGTEGSFNVSYQATNADPVTKISVNKDTTAVANTTIEIDTTNFKLNKNSTNGKIIATKDGSISLNGTSIDLTGTNTNILGRLTLAKDSNTATSDKLNLQYITNGSYYSISSSPRLDISSQTKLTIDASHNSLILEPGKAIQLTNENNHIWKFNTNGTLYCPNTITGTLDIDYTASDAGTRTKDIILAKFAANDKFRLQVGGESDNGYVEFATADNGNEPIYFRQYQFDSNDSSKSFNTVVHEFIALDGSGQTHTETLVIKNSLNFANNKIQFKNDGYPLVIGGLKVHTNGSLSTSQSIEASYFNATSDRRLKDNIEPFKYGKSILDLPIYTFTFKGESDIHIGCLAQDLQELYPELVSTREDGYLSIKESKLLYLLLEEVKQLKRQIKN